MTIETALREPLSTPNVKEQGREGVRRDSPEVGAPGSPNPPYAAPGTLKCVAPATPECVDVRTLGRFKVRVTEDHVKGSRISPWNIEIHCARWEGRIFPHGGTRLQAWITTRHVKAALRKLQAVGATPWQVGDREATVIFDVSDFARVAAVIRPRKKRMGPSKRIGFYARN